MLLCLVFMVLAASTHSPSCSYRESLRSTISDLLPVSSIESKDSSVIGFMAGFIWALYIVTSFPPGALTVEPANFTKVVLTVVPTFNASSVSRHLICGIFLTLL